MRTGRGKGYIGKSMSVNAREAHMRNEMPISHFTKKRILEIIKEEEVETPTNFKQLVKQQLHDLFLVNTSWHHTGSLYNVTDFYTLDLGAVSEITEEEINELIKQRKEHLENTKEERQKEKEAQEERRKERDYEKYIKSFTKISTYKTENGLLKAVQSGRVKLEDLEELKVKKVEERRKQLEPMWKNDPNAQEQYSRINDDEFIWENYI